MLNSPTRPILAPAQGVDEKPDSFYVFAHDENGNDKLISHYTHLDGVGFINEDHVIKTNIIMKDLPGFRIVRAQDLKIP